MAPTTKEGQRAELHKTIWRIANDLRGSVDGWDFKSYVLGMLFYRFISENLTAYINTGERQAGDQDFNYATLPPKPSLRRVSTSCRPTFSRTSASLHRAMRTSTKNWLKYLETLKARRSEMKARRTSKDFLTTLMLIAQS
jgi:type I restriction enzyme M protein